MSFRFCAEGIGAAPITSTHTSLAAARAAAALPSEAFAQIPSTLLLTLAASLGSRSMISLQIATYSLTIAALAAELPASAGVVVVAVLAGLLGVELVVLVGVLAAVVVGALVDVVPLVVELALLPQAARSAEHNSARTSSEIRLPVMDLPLVS